MKEEVIFLNKTQRKQLRHHSRSGEFAIRDGDWKLITDHNKKPKLLFNIGNDLAEQNNQYDKLEKQCQSGRSVAPEEQRQQRIDQLKGI